MMNFIDFINSIKNEPAIVAVLTRVCALFGCSNIIGSITLLLNIFSNNLKSLIFKNIFRWRLEWYVETRLI